MNKLLILIMAGAFAGCAANSADATDDTGDDSDAVSTGPCEQAGGECTSTMFPDASGNVCGTDQPLATSCGSSAFWACCPVPPASKLMAKAPVNLSMPTDVITFLTDNTMGDHHLGWHMSRQWDRLAASDKRWLASPKHLWKKATYQEGTLHNGLEFLAMHRSVLTLLRNHAWAAKTTVALFDGWTNVPDPSNTNVAKVGPDSLAQNPTAHNADATLPDALRDTIAMCEGSDDDQQKLLQFETDDDFGRFIETSAGLEQGVTGVGVHNYLHNRFSQAGSSIDLGDPQANFKNQIFWRLHGWVDRCWSTYRALKVKNGTGQDDADDAAYQTALAKGLGEMYSGPAQ